MAEKKTKNVDVQPNWHPDFRDPDALPDVKAVRTNFLVNFAALSLAIGLFAFFIFNEFQARSLAASIEEQRSIVQQGSAKNKDLLKLSSEFSKLSPKAEDLTRFYAGYDYPIDVIVAVSQSRPENIALQSFATGKTGGKKPASRYTLRGVLKGDSVEALEALDEYKVILGDLEVFEDSLRAIEVSQPSRNARLGLFEFTIVITLKAA